MKRLYLVRHAKSDKGNPLLEDFDRPLNDRGYRDAYFMSELMAKEKNIPEVLLSSPAVRAYSTALIFLKKFGLGTGRLILDERLYQEEAANYTEALKSLPDSHRSVMLFAHNPTITEVANIFSDRTIDSFPTCGICCIDLEIKSWKELSSGKGRQQFFEFPKSHL